MNICAISPTYEASSEDIINLIEKLQVEDLIILPGVADNTPSIKDVQNVINDNCCIFLENGFLKGEAQPLIVSKNDIIKIPRQLFINRPKAAEIDQLIKIFPARTHLISNQRVSFVLCGEINGFNPDGNLKHNRQLPSDRDFYILVNPCHTIMGHWNYLGKKLANLSNNERIVIYVTNNDKNYLKAISDVRIYTNGNEIREFKDRTGNRRISYINIQIEDRL